MRVCQQLSVLDFGQIIAQGPPAEIRANEAVLAAYLGSSADAGLPPAPSGDGGVS
jgi:ABC-type lipopolysaccharide export system ATPase subunit